MCDDLPDYHIGKEFKTGDTRRYRDLRDKQAELSIELNNLNTEIANIERVAQKASGSVSRLHTIGVKSSGVTELDLNCPICGSHVDNEDTNTRALNEALDSLNIEVATMSSFSRFDSEHLESLKLEKREVQSRIAAVNIEIKEVEQFNDKVKEYRDKRDSLGYLKAKIHVVNEQILNQIKITNYGEESLQEELRNLKIKLSSYDFESDLKKCQSALDKWINGLVMNLDFEEEFLPTDISLNLKDLSMINRNKKYGKMGLSDLGSGANWLAFHLAASLAMQRLFVRETANKPRNLVLEPAFAFAV